METLEKILIYENTKEISDTRLKAKSAARNYDLLFKAYKPLGVPADITSIDQLYELASDPESFVKEAYLSKMPQTVDFGGVKIKRSAIEDHIDMPDLTQLKNAALGVRRAAHIIDEKITQFDLYRITDQGVEINEEELAQELERWRRYATTEEERERYAYAKKLCDILNEGREQYNSFFPSRDELEKALRVVSKKGLTFVPNDNFVKPYKK